MDMSVRRPLSSVFLAYMLGIGSYYIFTPHKITYFLGIVSILFCVVVSIFTLGGKVKYKTIMGAAFIVVVFFLGGLICMFEWQKSDPIEEYEGSEITYRGTGIKYQFIKDDFCKITVKNGSFKYLLHVSGENVKPENIIGSNIIFKGIAEKPSPRRNPGCFDYSLYLKTINIRTIIKCDLDNITMESPSLSASPVNWFFAKLAGIKYEYLKTLSRYMSDEYYSLLTGMLFGNKDDIDEETYEAFQKNGIAHILSVSGIHVGIVYAFIYMLLGRRMNLATVGLMFAFLFIYAFLSEFSPSVIRASIMIGIHMISKLLMRPYDLLTGTCLAALIMLIANPLSLFHIGFQLSFFAVMLLAFFLPFVNRYVGVKKIIGLYKERRRDEGNGLHAGNDISMKNKIVNTLKPLVIIQVGMAPLTAFLFNYFSVAGLFMNIPIIFFAGIIIPIGITMMPVALADISIFSDFILITGCKLLDLILWMMVEINDMIFSLKFSSFLLTSPLPWLLFVLYGVLFFFASETFRILSSRSMVRMVFAALIIIITASVLCSASSICTRDQSDVVFVDVGQGDCIHVRTPSGKNILIDGGGNMDYNVGKKTLLPYFLKNGVNKIDYAFVSHLHTDHFQGIKELSNYMKIGKLMTYDGNRAKPEEITSGSGIDTRDIVYLGAGDRFAVDKDVYIDILYPHKKSLDDYVSDLEFEEDENKNSLFMKLFSKGSTILVTGDLDEEGEKLIMRELKDPESNLKSDILKVGHHGSRYSTSQEFLDMVSPQNAVIQVGVNNTYGHPTGEVIEKLQNKDIMIYRNDTDGAIMVDLNKSGTLFRKMIDGD